MEWSIYAYRICVLRNGVVNQKLYIASKSDTGSLEWLEDWECIRLCGTLHYTTDLAEVVF